MDLPQEIIMTDRIHALTVVLDRDIREDDIEDIIAAIKMNRFVADVKIHVANTEDYMARARVRSDIRFEIHKAIEKIFDDKGK